MKHNPDNRSDNVENIQRNIDSTVRNIHRADEMMHATDNPQTKQELSAKNERRSQALNGMRAEIKGEADYRAHKKKH